MTPAELPIADGGPCDPDRAWDWRDSGDGAEDADDDGPGPPIGPVDTDYSYSLAKARYPSLVMPKDYPRSGQVPGRTDEAKGGYHRDRLGP